MGSARRGRGQATLAKVDFLRGFKENVIMGHLIPAGTGFITNRNFNIEETEKSAYPARNRDLEAEAVIA